MSEAKKPLSASSRANTTRKRKNAATASVDDKENAADTENAASQHSSSDKENASQVGAGVLDTTRLCELRRGRIAALGRHECGIWHAFKNSILETFPDSTSKGFVFLTQFRPDPSSEMNRPLKDL